MSSLGIVDIQDKKKCKYRSARQDGKRPQNGFMSVVKEGLV